MKEENQLGRLIIKREGHFWNAYHVVSDKAEDSNLIGSICIGAVANNTEMRDAFKAMMTNIVFEAIKEITGTVPTMVKENHQPIH